MRRALALLLMAAAVTIILVALALGGSLWLSIQGGRIVHQETRVGAGAGQGSNSTAVHHALVSADFLCPAGPVAEASFPQPSAACSRVWGKTSLMPRDA